MGLFLYDVYSQVVIRKLFVNQGWVLQTSYVDIYSILQIL